MKQRCQNPRCKAYRNYGARGIKVCKEWQQFEPFLAWALKNGYQKGLELDRSDNDGDYEPSNCRWISRRDNLNNRRNTIMIDVDGEVLPDTVWAERLGIDRALLKQWLTNHGPDYTATRIKDILANGYTPRNFAYGHGKPIRHVESDQFFRSIREAAKCIGLSHATLFRAMKKDGVTSKGRFTWETVEES